MSSTRADHHDRSSVVYFDFDNTISTFDVLDSIIERFAADRHWEELEREWQAGRLSTRDCLDGQVRSLRVTWSELREHLRAVKLDPAFLPLLALLRQRGIEHMVVSDSFSVIIAEVFAQHGIADVPIFANELTFTGDRVIPHFPHSNPDHPACAHCKRLHLLARPAQPSIYVGDGRSDLCPALVADVVFAKDSLLRDLTARKVACRPITDLSGVLEYFQNEVPRDLRAPTLARV
ncbi:MAG: MtnX-like HAD-IB family phosphatase [Chthoniobacteraceae bacterium]